MFKAVTHGNETVAVKAQYIDLRDRYDGDIWTIQFLLKLVGWIHPKFKLSWIFHVRALACIMLPGNVRALACIVLLGNSEEGPLL